MTAAESEPDPVPSSTGNASGSFEDRHNAPSSLEEPTRRRMSLPSLVLALASAFLLWLAFPTHDWGWFGWFGLAPLLGLAVSGRSAWWVYPSAYLGGVAFWLLCLNWVTSADPSTRIGWVLMAVVLAYEWPVAVGLIRLMTRSWRIPLVLAAPLAWVAMEHIRAYLLTGLPWYDLAHSQYRYPIMIQMADLTGSLGISFVLVMVNACLVEAWTIWSPFSSTRLDGSRPRPIGSLVVTAVTLIGMVGYGIIRCDESGFQPGPRIALLQSDLVQQLDSQRDRNEIIKTYVELMRKATADPDRRPDLMVWPETSYPSTLRTAIDPDLDQTVRNRALAEGYAKTLEEWRRRRVAVEGELRRLAGLFPAGTSQDPGGTPMLVAAISRHITPEGLRKYNSAILVEPGQAIEQFYHKRHLVPFGEYVPLLETFPVLAQLTPYPPGQIPSLNFGTDSTPITWGDYRFAVAICFEDTISRVVRQGMRSNDADGRGPDLLINLSNDGWFRRTDEQPMHLAISVFRCVENRIPLVRAVNTGISALVDGNGQIRERLEAGVEDVLIVDVPLDPRAGLYTIVGDWPGAVSLTCCGLFLVATHLRRFRPGSRPREVRAERGRNSSESPADSDRPDPRIAAK